jgi:peroxiredoxin
LFWRHVVAAAEDQEKAGNDEYQGRHMNAIFQEGFSFSGYERDLLSWSQQGREFLTISGISGVDSISDGRGSVYADFDNDGDLDIFLVALQGNAHYLFRNNLGSENNFLRVSLRGVDAGRDAFGALVHVKTSQGVQTRVRTGGSGFLSQHDPRLLFGLGKDSAAEWMEVTWPGGDKQRWENLGAGSYEIRQGHAQIERIRETVSPLPDPNSEKQNLIELLTFGEGDHFPDLELRPLEGEPLRLHELAGSAERTFVNLWATFCVPCRREMPELQSLHERFRAQGIQLVGVSLDRNNIEVVPRFLMRLGVQYPNYTAGSSAVQQIYSGEEVQIPLSFLLDREGRVLQFFGGWSKDTQDAIHELLGSP